MPICLQVAVFTQVTGIEGACAEAPSSSMPLNGAESNLLA